MTSDMSKNQLERAKMVPTLWCWRHRGVTLDVVSSISGGPAAALWALWEGCCDVAVAGGRHMTCSASKRLLRCCGGAGGGARGL